MEILSNFVAGRWTPATGKRAVVRSPIDGEVVHEVCFAGEAEIDAAQAALPSAAAAPKAQRARALRDLAAGLKRRAPAISLQVDGGFDKPDHIAGAKPHDGVARGRAGCEASPVFRMPVTKM
jgi:hypothetical protein